MTKLPASGLSLGIDIGGTKTHGILLDADGHRLAESIRPTRIGPDGVVATTIDVVADCLGKVDSTDRTVLIGIGIPGQVDPAAGLVRTAVNLGISELDLGPRLSAALGLPVTVDNDVKAAALGAANHLGIAGGDLAYLNFGTGVAAAAVVNGRLVRGHGNLAGEIGHIPVDPRGDRCHCGQRGCIEVLAGGGRIAERLAASGPELTLVNLVEAAEAGDPTAVAEAHRICTGIALAVQLVVLTQGSARVVLGGGVVHAAPDLVPRVQQILADRAAGSEFLASLGLAERITVIPAGYPVAAIGAALVGMSRSRARQLAPIG
ncbi:MAG: ROK family protein [Propionibacteriaceae bacterium]|nr:ROK family protein [Propionibacteriaceae bacterium]